MLFRNPANRICTCARSLHTCVAVSCVAARPEWEQTSRLLKEDGLPAIDYKLPLRRDFAGKTRLEVHLLLVVLGPEQSCLVRRRVRRLGRDTLAPRSDPPTLVAARKSADRVVVDTRAFRVAVGRESTAGEARTAGSTWLWKDL